MIVYRPRTLLWQLGFALMALQAAAVVFLGWYAWTRFDQFNRDQTVLELQRSLQLLLARYADVIKGQSSDTLESTLRQMVENDGDAAELRITLVRPDGVVIADSFRDPAQLDNHLQRPEVQMALRGDTGGAQRRSVTTDQDTRYVAGAILRDGRPALVVRVARPLDLLNAEPSRIVRVVALAAAFSLLLGFIVILLVSRQLSQTVSNLADSAARFAAGDLNHRVDRPAALELAGLAEALNRMAEQLNDQIDLLRSQRSEQQAIHQSMSNGMIALDLGQHVISVNRAAERLLKIDGASSRGRMMQEVLREPELNRFVAESVAGIPHASSEFKLRGPSGPTVQAASEPLRNARDQPVGLLVFITDVTQLRRLESIRSDFAANVSHELRTPITNIKGYVETMLDIGVEDGPQTHKFLEIIRRNTGRLASIIEDLLALARLEQPDTKATLERDDIPLARTIEAAVALFEAEIAEKRTVVEVQVPRDLHLHANAQLLEQAIGNLLSNAIRYSPGGTAVRVTGRRLDSGEVEIAVIDQGPGIPPEHQTRIFERFYRVDRARSRELGGTGLGLSIVKHIALVHGGRVEVESEVGQGSTFRIVLPQAVD